MTVLVIDLVDIDEARRFLRYDGDSHDQEIETFITQASSIVLDYLKLSSVPDDWTEDSSGSPVIVVVPGLIKAATLNIIGELDKNRLASLADMLSPGVCAILARWRDPTLA